VESLIKWGNLRLPSAFMNLIKLAFMNLSKSDPFGTLTEMICAFYVPYCLISKISMISLNRRSICVKYSLCLDITYNVHCTYSPKLCPVKNHGGFGASTDKSQTSFCHDHSLLGSAIHSDHFCSINLATCIFLHQLKALMDCNHSSTEMVRVTDIKSMTGCMCVLKLSKGICS